MGLFDIFKPKSTETTSNTSNTSAKPVGFTINGNYDFKNGLSSGGVHADIVPGTNKGITGTPGKINISGDQITVNAGIASGIEKGKGAVSYTPGSTNTTKLGSLNIGSSDVKPKVTASTFKPKIGNPETQPDRDRFEYDRHSDKLSDRAHRAGLRAGEDYDNISDEKRAYIDTYYNTLDRAEITKPFLELEGLIRNKDYSSDKFDSKYQQLMDYIDEELKAERKANGAYSKQYKALEQVKEDVTRLGAQYAVDKQYAQNQQASGQLDESINAIFAGVMNSKDYDSTVNAGRQAVSQNSSAKKWFDKNMVNASETQRNLMYYTYQKEGLAGVKEMFNDYMGETLNTVNAGKDFISDIVSNPDRGDRFWQAAKAGHDSAWGSWIGGTKQTFTNTESDPENRELIAGYTANDAVDYSLRSEIGAVVDSEEFRQYGDNGFLQMRADGVKDAWYLDAQKNATELQRQILGNMYLSTEGDTAAVEEVWRGIKESENQIWGAVHGVNTLPHESSAIEGEMYRDYLGMSGQKAPSWLSNGSNQTLAQTLWDATVTTIGQMPQVIGQALGSLTAFIPGVGAAAKYIGAATGAAAMTTGAYGNAYKEARDQGYEKSAAQGYAATEAASEFLADFLFSGVGPVGGILENAATSKILANIASPIARTFANLGLNMLSEGSQEYVQEIFEPIVRNFWFDEGNDFSLYTEDARYNFFMGAFSSVLLGNPSADLKANLSHSKIGAALNAQNSTKKLVDKVLAADIDSVDESKKDSLKEAKKLAEKMNSGSYNENDVNAGELLDKAVRGGVDVSFLDNPATVSYTKEQLSVDDLRAGAVSRLAALGGNTEMAEDVAKLAKGMSVSEESQSAIQKDTAATQVLQELQGELNLEENNALTIAARSSQIDGTFAKITAAVQANNPDKTILSPNAQFIKEQGVGLADAQRIGAVFDKVMDGHQITKAEAKLINVRNKGVQGALLARLDIDLLETASTEAVMQAMNEKAAQVARVKDMQAGVRQATAQTKAANKSGARQDSAATQNAKKRRRGKKNGTAAQKSTGVSGQAGTEAAAGAEAQSLRGAGAAGSGQVAAGGPGGVRTLQGGVDVSQRGERLESSVRGPGHGDIGDVIPVDQLTEDQRNTQRRLAADGFGSIRFMNGGISHTNWNEDLGCYEVYIRVDGPFSVDQYSDHETGHLWVKAMSDAHREQFFQLVRNAFGEDFREAFTQIRQKYVGLGAFPKDVKDNRVIEEMYCFARGAQNCSQKGLKDSILKFDFSKYHDAMLEIEQFAALEDMAKGNLNNPQVRQNYEAGNFNREYYERQGYLDEDFAPAPVTQAKAEEKKPTIPKKTTTEKRTEAKQTLDKLTDEKKKAAEAKTEKPKKSKSKKAPIPAKSESEKLKEHYEQRKAAQQRKFDEGKLSKTEEQLQNKLKKLDNEYQQKLMALYREKAGSLAVTPEAIARAEKLSDDVRNDLISELSGLQAELKADPSIADNAGFLTRVKDWFDKASAAIDEANKPKVSALQELRSRAEQLVANPELANDPEFVQRNEELLALATAEMAERAANAQVDVEQLAEDTQQEAEQEEPKPAFDYDAELKKLDDWRNARRKSQYEKMAKNPEKSDASLNAQLKKIEDEYTYKKQALVAKARRNGDTRSSIDPDEDFDAEELMDRRDEMRSGYNEAQIWQDSSLNEEDVDDTDSAQPSADDDYDAKMNALMAELDAHPERTEEIFAQMTALAEERSESNTRALEERSAKPKPKKTEAKKTEPAKAETKTEPKKPVIPPKTEPKKAEAKTEPRKAEAKAEKPAAAKAFQPKAEKAKTAPVNEATPELKKPELHRGQNPVDVKGLDKKKAIDKVTREKTAYESWYAQEKSKLDKLYDDKKIEDAKYAKEFSKLTERRNKEVGRYNDQLKRLEVMEETVKEKPTVVKDTDTAYTPKVGEWYKRIKNGTNIQIRRLRSDRNTYDVRFTDSKGNQVVYETVSPSMLEKALGEGFRSKAEAKSILDTAYDSAASSLGEWQSVDYAKRAEEKKPGKPKPERALDNYGRKIPYRMEARMANSTVRDSAGRLLSVYRLGPANGVRNANPNARFTLWSERPATMNLMRGLNGLEAYDQANKGVGADIEKWLQELEEHPRMSEGNKNAIRAKIAAAERKAREYTTHVTRLDPWRPDYSNPNREDVIGNRTLLEGYVDIRNPLVIDAKGKGMAYVRDTIQDFVNDPANLAGQVDVDGNALGEYDGIKFINVTVTEGNKSLGGGQLDRDTIYATFRANQGKSTYNTNPTDSELMQYSLDPEMLDEYDKEAWATDPETGEIIGIQDLDGRPLSKGQAEYFAGSKSVDKDGNVVNGVVPLWLSSDTFGFLAYDNKGRSDDGLSIFLSDDFLVGGSYAVHGDRAVDLVEHEKLLQGIADRLGVDINKLPNVGDLVSISVRGVNPKTQRWAGKNERATARKQLADMYNAAVDVDKLYKGGTSKKKIVGAVPVSAELGEEVSYNESKLLEQLNAVTDDRSLGLSPFQVQKLESVFELSSDLSIARLDYEEGNYDGVRNVLSRVLGKIYSARNQLFGMLKSSSERAQEAVNEILDTLDTFEEAVIYELRFNIPTSLLYDAPQDIRSIRVTDEAERYDTAMNDVFMTLPAEFMELTDRLYDIDKGFYNLEQLYTDVIYDEDAIKKQLFELRTKIYGLNSDFVNYTQTIPSEDMADPKVQAFVKTSASIFSDLDKLYNYSERAAENIPSSVDWRAEDGSNITLDDITEVLPSSASWSVYAKTTNPLIVDGADELGDPGYWSSIDMSDNEDFAAWNATENKYPLDSVREANTRSISNYAYARGYDSVIIRSIIDVGGPGHARARGRASNIYCVFNPEQIKSVNNLDPTDSEMMNHSIDPDTETGYAEGTLEDTILRVLQDKDYDHAVESLTMYLAQYLQTGVLPEIENERTRQIFQPRITPAERNYLNERARELIDKYGAFEQGEKPVRQVFMPKERADGNVRQTYRTAAESQNTPEWGVDFLMREVLTSDDAVYEKITDKSAIAAANRDMRSKGYNQMLAEWRAKADSNAAYNIDKYDIAKAVALYSEAFSAGNAEDAMAIIAEIAEVETTAGQIVQAARLIKKMPPSYQLYYLRRVVNRLNQRYKKRIDSGRMPEITLDRDLARAVVRAKSQEELDTAMKALIEDVAKNIPVTLADQWNAWRYLSMLGNPKTHFRNLLGNAIFVPAKFSKDLIAAGLEGMFIKNSLERRTSIKGVVGRNTEYRELAKADYETVKQELQSGGKYNIANEIMDARTIFKWSKTLEFLRKFNGEKLESEDGAFLKFHYVNALTNFLATQGMSVKDLQTTKEGRKIMNAARLYAFNEAQKATYRDASRAAAALNQLKNSKSGLIGVLLEGVFPFTKTPINILKRGVEYSPIGLLDSLSRGLYLLKSGNITANEFIDSIASGLTGTGVVLLGMWLSSMGLLRGGSDDDESQDEFNKLQGYQNYSINLGDYNYTIDWAAPVALPLFVGCELINQMRKGGQLSLSDWINAALVVAEPLTQLSMLSGVNELLTSAKWDKHAFASAIMTSGFSYITQAFPTLVAQLSRSITPDRRTTFVDKNSDIPQPIQRWWQTNVLGKTPLNAQRTEYIDAWGRKDTTSSFAMRLFENMLSPGYINRVKTTPVDTELQKLADSVGSGVLMTTPERSIQFGNVKHNLTAEQYKTYAKTRGDSAMAMLTDLFGSDGYQNEMSDSEKAYAVNLIKQYANILGKQAVFNEYDTTDDNWAEKCDGDPTRIINTAMLKAKAHETGVKYDSSVAAFSFITQQAWLSPVDQAYAVAQQFNLGSDDYVYEGGNSPKYAIGAEEKEIIAEHYRQIFPAYYLELVDTQEWQNADDEAKSELLAAVRKDAKADAKAWMARILAAQGAPLYVKK